VPLAGESFVAVARKHMNEPVPELTSLRPDAPLRLVAAVERALEKDPRRRFASMDELARELRACTAELGSTDLERTFAAPGPVLRTGGRRTMRARRRPAWPWLVLLLLGAAAAAVVAVVLALGGSKDTPTSPPG